MLIVLEMRLLLWRLLTSGQSHCWRNGDRERAFPGLFDKFVTERRKRPNFLNSIVLVKELDNTASGEDFNRTYLACNMYCRVHNCRALVMWSIAKSKERKWKIQKRAIKTKCAIQPGHD